MKHTSLVTKVFLLVTAILLLMCGGCKKAAVQQNDSEKALIGKWAYAHETDKAVAVFSEDGSAKYDGKNYSFESDGSFIKLTDSKGNAKNLRYIMGDSKMYLFKPSVYTCQNEGTASGVVGYWKDLENQWTFEFTASGTFMEDGVLTGYYSVDEEAGTIHLVYGDGDEMDATTFYYHIDGNEMSVEYPWLMLKMEN